MSKVSVRYIVDDVDSAIAFYRDLLGFEVEMRPAPGFAAVGRGGLRLLLNEPGAGGVGQDAEDGTTPCPGGWNRFQLEVDDLEPMVRDLERRGARFRSRVVAGKGGKQALLEDPAGNVVELFEPLRR